jgi:DNA-binding transcriptional ArsR family regulator
VPSDQPIYALKAKFLRGLGHPARVRILELLQEGERTVGELRRLLNIDSSSTSQHLGALRRQGLLESRRNGTRVHYRVKDPHTFQLLEVARQILTSNLQAAQVLLSGLASTSSLEGSVDARERDSKSDGSPVPGRQGEQVE